MFNSVETICRTVKGNDKIFGRIQVIAAASFWQLPHVPSVCDAGLYYFQSDSFLQVFPHQINLKQVKRQHE